ncbi:MAG: CBS domain-containing protein, partial [Gemmataceae bacterium]
ATDYSALTTGYSPMRCPSCDRDNLHGVDWCANCLNDLTEQDRPLPQDRVEHALMGECVGALSPRAPLTMPPHATVADAVDFMLAQDIGAVLVTDPAGALIGILSERDVLLRGTGRLRATVGELMTRRPETVRETDSLAFALHKMDCGGYRHLPVLRDRRLVGMISVRDLLGYITRICEGVGDVG